MKPRSLVCSLLIGFASLQAADSPSPIAPILQSLLDQQLVSGVVTLVTDQDKILELDAAGRASLRTQEPMRTDSLFWIASMSKSITTVGLMMLVDEGKVNVDDPVEKYLPEFKGQMIAGTDEVPAHAPRRPITIVDILTHTSGLVLASDKALKKEHSLAANVANIAAMPLRQEPGTKFEYNNCGISTAGRIIEVVSGLSYADFMQRRVFDPLEMKDTTFWPNDSQAARLAHTSRRADDKTSLEEIQQDKGVTPALIEKLGHGVTVPAAILGDMGIGMVQDYAEHFAEPAGGLFSTASNLGSFCRMLLAGGTYRGKRLLSEEAVKNMGAIHTGEVRVNPDEAWGLGVTVKIHDNEGPSVGSYGHRGARRTAMWIDPKTQIAMVILVERFDMSGEEQKIMYGSFMKAAEAAYGRK